MWDLIVSVPDHCLSFYFTRKLHTNELVISGMLKKYYLAPLNLHTLLYEGVDGGIWNSLISKNLALYCLSLKFLLIL